MLVSGRLHLSKYVAYRGIVQACCRSLIVDTLPIPLQQTGSAWGMVFPHMSQSKTLTVILAGRMCAIGQLFAYVVGSIDTVSIFGSFLGDTQFKQMTVIAALLLVGAVAVTSYSVKERVLISARWVYLTLSSGPN
jgi:solute carrier family 45 protein 1/2/4